MKLPTIRPGLRKLIRAGGHEKPLSKVGRAAAETEGNACAGSKKSFSLWIIPRPASWAWPRFTNLSILGAFAFAGVLPGSSGGVLDPKGPVSAGDSFILINAVEIMLIIIVPTIIATVAFAWWFRASNTRAIYRPGFVYSGQIEFIVWSIPILVILFLSGIIWIGSHELDPAQPLATAGKPVEVKVVSLDWKWLFIYPEQGVASVNELVLPEGAPAHLSLTSATVMNSFFVPQLAGMISVMNGMVTQLYLQADHTGDYWGQSNQFSGDGFSDMHFEVRALPKGGFSQWVSMARNSSGVLDRAAYDRLLEQSDNVAPHTYGDVDPTLFEAIVTQKILPGPGPKEGAAGAGVHPVTEHHYGR